jgi:hypothetical protein
MVAAHEISRGKGDGRFAPDEHVTRGQMATFINNTHRALAGEPFAPVEQYFSDAGAVHEFSVEGLAHVGLVAGISRGVFAPERTVTRAQMAGFLGRLLDVEVDDRRLPWAYAEPGSAHPAV